MADRLRRSAVAVMVSIVSACGTPPTVADNRTEALAAMRSNDTGNALEALAEESGVIGEDASTDPMGSYGRAYEGGEDRLCVLPATADDKSHGFGVEIRIGQEEYCRGRGDARWAGNLLILRFSGGRCTITARYDGDRIVLPGAVDSGCASLCSGRGSFAGVSFPRVALDARAARSVTDNDGRALCEH